MWFLRLQHWWGGLRLCNFFLRAFRSWQECNTDAPQFPAVLWYVGLTWSCVVSTFHFLSFMSKSVNNQFYTLLSLSSVYSARKAHFKAIDVVSCKRNHQVSYLSLFAIKIAYALQSPLHIVVSCTNIKPILVPAVAMLYASVLDITHVRSPVLFKSSRCCINSASLNILKFVLFKHYNSILLSYGDFLHWRICGDECTRCRGLCVPGYPSRLSISWKWIKCWACTIGWHILTFIF